MTRRRRYTQLKLEIQRLNTHFDAVPLRFLLQGGYVSGILKGNHQWWVFTSDSPGFRSHIPDGRLCKYSLWTDRVPPVVSELYNAIWEAAIKSGYDLAEQE
ncbi:MAG: hypothetical protein JWP27_2635 [Flaviaesturariibacter sp.]|nr:hypothetical protein [Flaviaesturariibacter sp.]